MKKAIHVSSKKEELKPIEYTHYLNKEKGWIESGRQPTERIEPSDVYYLGKCTIEGDMFMDVDGIGQICIFKGHLNSGTY